MLTSFGGTEKVIISHQKMFNENGIAYIYIYPVQKTVMFGKLFNYWGLIIDGSFCGLYTTEEIISMSSDACNGNNGLLKIHVHHLKRINLVELEKILNYFSECTIYLYGHDYYLFCNQYNLMKNDKEYCGPEAPSDFKCGGCSYYDFREDANKRAAFIYKYINRSVLIVPSDAATKIFASALPEWKERIKVIYHQRFIGHFDNNRETLDKSARVKVAFCGLPLPIKGWDQWVKIVNAAENNNANLELYHFGRANEYYDNVKSIEVGFRNGMLTMPEALRNYHINCVILWSLVPETYSYVYYECLSANVFVITYKDSGNIAYQVNKNRNGIVLESEEQLYALLKMPDKLIDLINEMRANNDAGPKEMVENNEIVLMSDGQPLCVKNKSSDVTRSSYKKKLIEKIYIRHLRNKWKVNI